ncbi:hypothetical protein CU098_005392, partial [Rhizopus stolonifer]
MIRVAYNSLEECWFAKKPRTVYNYECTEGYNRTTSQGKTKLLTSGFSVMSEMLQSNFGIAEYQSIATKILLIIPNETKETEKANIKINNAKVLITQTENAGYWVQYQVYQEENGTPIVLKDIFFGHKNMTYNAKKLGQALVIDTTYMQMRLISVYGEYSLVD